MTLPKEKNKKVLILMKDKLGGKIITKLMYEFWYDYVKPQYEEK